jgi:hypothetical protein
MGSYTGEIDFSNKYITIWGQGGTLLDAAGGGRFFSGSGAGSWLVLHGVVLQNGAADSTTVSLGITFHTHYLLALSERFWPKELSQIFAPIPGGPHGIRGTIHASTVMTESAMSRNIALRAQMQQIVVM